MPAKASAPQGGTLARLDGLGHLQKSERNAQRTVEGTNNRWLGKSLRPKCREPVAASYTRAAPLEGDVAPMRYALIRQSDGLRRAEALSVTYYINECSGL